MTPAVSVIIPFRGRIPLLREAVGSVLAQTFRDFELILVNDGSDEQVSFLDEVRDDRIRYIRQPPSGAAAARNLGIRKATGKYVAFLDSDDLYLPSKLEIQLRTMQERPGFVFSHTSYVRMDAAGRDLERIDSGGFAGRVYPGIVTCCEIATPTVMVLRDLFENLKFEESVRMGEDIILWVRIARHHEILGIREPLTRIRIHGNNATLNREAQLEGRRNVLRFAFREDPSFSPAFRRESYAGLHNSVAEAYRREGRDLKALAVLLAGTRYSPTDRTLRNNISDTLRSAARAAVPVRLRESIKRLRDVVRGCDGGRNK
ncbi:MAG: glycosyltransferase [Deltaproteobacteria bacterium]|nr:glycosyltransferase [Deltaproteobacteria bacterium]